MADEIKNNNNPIKTEQPAPKQNNPMPKMGGNKIESPVKTETKPNKALKQMGLSENDLEPIDQSPLYKAKMAAIEAGEKGGYRDYSDFNQKGELISRPAKTVSAMGDMSKFNPEAQIRSIKDFGDHIEYQLKNPEDADFRDFRYDEKNGHLPKDEARVKANGNKFDISKYPDVEKTPYGFIYNVNGESITDLKEQDRKFGRNIDDNKNYGFTVTKDGDEVYYETFEDAYNAAKGINSNDDDEEKEYDNIDDDYERSYGPVTNDKEYQAYLKWKENGDSFDNVGDKIRKQMGISEEEWNEPYNDGMVNIDKGKPQISNANLTSSFVDGKISGKEYYKEVNDRIKENNRKMQLMTSQVPYNGLDAKSKEEYDKIKEQNDEWNFIIDEYDLDNKYADSKALNQMGLGEEEDIMEALSEQRDYFGDNATIGEVARKIADDVGSAPEKVMNILQEEAKSYGMNIDENTNYKDWWQKEEEIEKNNSK